MLALPLRVSIPLAVCLTIVGLASCSRVSTKLLAKKQSPASLAAFVLGSAQPCPTEMARVKNGDVDVCVDRYEAALEGWRFSRPPEGAAAADLAATPAKGTEPQVNVSQLEAEAACERAQKRLCTEPEWLTACRGPSRTTYPYGNQYVPGACNEGRPSPVATRANGASFDKLDDPRLAEAPNGIAPGGSFEQCVSADGIYDMHGNVHEWVSTSPKPQDDRFGEFLGGFFAEAKENGAGCSYRTTAHVKTYHDYSTGFRCCKDPND